MNAMQKVLCGTMLAILLGFLAYPEWTVTWTQRLDYKYYYDADIPAGASGPSPETWQAGFDLERCRTTRRHLVFFRPKPSSPPLPSPKSERTGTGAVELGLRHTVYTGTSVVNVSAALNRRKMAWEAFVLLIPTGMFLIMFRDNVRRRVSLTPQEPPKFIPTLKTGEPSRKSMADTPHPFLPTDHG